MKGRSRDPHEDQMRDEVTGRPIAEDDDIEIIEVVGMDDDLAPLEEQDDAPDEAEQEIVLDFDDDETALEAADDQEVEADADGAAGAERDRRIRLQADFDNFRKRTERERAAFERRATTSVVSRLLPVIDNLERALEAPVEADDAFRDGVRLIHRQLMDELRREGLRPIEAVGQPFDPNRHEAVATEPDPSVEPNTVLDELQRGYFFHERLLRPSLVKVSIAAPEEDS